MNSGKLLGILKPDRITTSTKIVASVTRIKICGITNINDALDAVSLGADALGFIAVPESPRYITPDAVAQIIAELPPFVITVAVANYHADGRAYPCDRIQFYNGPADNNGIFALRVQDSANLVSLPTLSASLTAVLLDKHNVRVLGGAGEVFDWQLAILAKTLTALPIILAGGLTPDNVAAAVAIVQPYAVDVSSGTERVPGIKDPIKLRDFIQAVRASKQ